MSNNTTNTNASASNSNGGGGGNTGNVGGLSGAPAGGEPAPTEVPPLPEVYERPKLSSKSNDEEIMKEVVCIQFSFCFVL